MGKPALYAYTLNVNNQQAAFAQFKRLLGSLGFEFGEDGRREQGGFFATYSVLETTHLPTHILHFFSKGKEKIGELGGIQFFLSERKGVMSASVCEHAGMPAIAKQCVMTMERYSTISRNHEIVFRRGPKGNQPLQQRKVAH
jgi:hypothetical protein